jgi:hypothetical protein
MRMQGLGRCAALAFLCFAFLGSNQAQADESNRVSGQFGFAFVGRNNRAALGKKYRSGILLGVHAGVELAFEDSPWSVGLGLITLVRGYYFASSVTAVDQTVDITEMSMGLRVRRRIPGAIHHLVGTFGGGFTASSVPLPPSFDRRHVGLYGGLGYNRRLVGEWTWGLETRYARYFDGPRNISLFGTFTAGFGN